MIDLEPDGAEPFSVRYPEGHAAIVEALHRYNVGPDWTRAECVELVRSSAYQRAAISELTGNYNRLCAAVAMRLDGIEPGRYIVLADDLSLLVVEDGLLEHDDLVIYDRARPL